MTVEIDVNGEMYEFPEEDDDNYGNMVLEWAQAISKYTLQEVGGTFNLQNDIDFGEEHGLSVPHLELKDKDGKKLNLSIDKKGVLHFNDKSIFKMFNEIDFKNKVDFDKEVDFGEDNGIIVPYIGIRDVKNNRLLAIQVGPDGNLHIDDRQLIDNRSLEKYIKDDLKLRKEDGKLFFEDNKIIYSSDSEYIEKKLREDFKLQLKEDDKLYVRDNKILDSSDKNFVLDSMPVEYKYSPCVIKSSVFRNYYEYWAEEDILKPGFKQHPTKDNVFFMKLNELSGGESYSSKGDNGPNNFVRLKDSRITLTKGTYHLQGVFDLSYVFKSVGQYHEEEEEGYALLGCRVMLVDVTNEDALVYYPGVCGKSSGTITENLKIVDQRTFEVYIVANDWDNSTSSERHRILGIDYPIHPWDTSIYGGGDLETVILSTITILKFD